MNSVHTTPFYLSKIYFNIILPLCLGLLSGLFPSDLRTKPLRLHPCYMPYPYHPPSIDHSNYTWRRVQVMKPFIMQLFDLVHSIFFCFPEVDLCDHLPVLCVCVPVAVRQRGLQFVERRIWPFCVGAVTEQSSGPPPPPPTEYSLF
jgi:hypothetical protein